MKTAFKAKIIFEADELPSGYLGVRLEWTMEKICEAIRSGEFGIEVVNDELTNDQEPVIIFKHKPKK